MLDVAEAEKILRDNGMRITPQRREVLAYLANNEEHPRVDSIAAHVQAKMPGVALSTIYNTVHELASLGLIVELMEKDGVHLDPKTELHAHMRCSNCGSISDVTLGKDLEDGLSQAAIASGAKPSTIKVDMVGLCPTCR